MNEPRGTFACPICGRDDIHTSGAHDPDHVDWYNGLTAQERIDREELAQLIAGSPRTKLTTADMIIRTGWRKVSSLPSVPAQEAWKCGARKQGTPGGSDPADCDWPMCGCDPNAGAVLAALEDQGIILEKSRETVTSDALSEFIGQMWWSGATCPSLADAILEKFDVSPRASSVPSAHRGGE